MLFALDVVNNRSSYLNSSLLHKYPIRFGALIYDSCDYESFAVERAMNFLLPSVSQCTSRKSFNQPSSVAGVIGSASSTVSMAIADILRLAEVNDTFVLFSSLENSPINNKNDTYIFDAQESYLLNVSINFSYLTIC